MAAAPAFTVFGEVLQAPVAAPQPPSSAGLLRGVQAPAQGKEGAASNHTVAALGLLASVAAVSSQRVAFRRRAAAARNVQRVTAAALPADATSDKEVGRAALLRGLSSSCAIAAGAVPLSAEAKSVDEATKDLNFYGVPQIAPTQLPFGWNAAVEPIGLADSAYYGRFKLGSEPLVVTFNVPPGWVVAKPNIDFNGTAGTVSANDFAKGDSATLWVDAQNEKDGVKTIEDMKKGDFYKVLKRALTQKGTGFIEALKISKVSDGTAPGYKILEYEYEIESGAGFSINRNGIAGVAQCGDQKNLQLFWTGVTTPRWDGMKSNLLQIAQSFRVAKLPKDIAEAQTGFYAEKYNNDEAATKRGKLY